MKKLLIILFYIVICFSVSAVEVKIELPEVLDPDSIFVTDKSLYIIEGDICRIYSIPGMKFLNSFCKSGEGPGEIKTMPGLAAGISGAEGGKIVLEGMNKILFYTHKGKFVEEKRKGGRFFRTNTAGENYVTLGITMDNKNGRGFLTLSVFDSDFKLVKELYKQEMKDNDKDIEMVIDTINYSVWENRIYLVKNKDNNPVIVFNSDGKELYSFDNRIDKKKIDSEFRENEIRRIRDDDFISMMIKREGGWDNFRKKMNFIFPNSLPAIHGITVSNNKICLLTYDKNDNKEKFVITDLNGNVLNSIFLPVPIKSSFLSKMLGRENKFYSFSGGKYYYLSENEETETFEIRIIDLNENN